MSQVYFITGTSSGFGRALAQAVLERGDRAVLTARRPDSVSDLVAQYGEQAMAVQLDVTNADQRRAAVEAAQERFGRVDVLVNNAGRGSLGAAEEFSEAQVREQMEINYFGAVGMIQALLPTLRHQGRGHILNVSSIGGLVGVGGFALYCASKFALEGYSECLRDEVEPLGIHVTIVEPGAFRTEFAGDANMRPGQVMDAYRPVVDPLRDYLYGNAGKQPGDPHRAAQAMIQAVESDHPPLRLILGADAYGLWEKKKTAMDDELDQWRRIGEDTAFPGLDVGAIGG